MNGGEKDRAGWNAFLGLELGSQEMVVRAREYMQGRFRDIMKEKGVPLKAVV